MPKEKLSKMDKRAIFLEMIADLIHFAKENGIRLICFSFHRTEKQQKMLYEYGKSKVKHSKHQDWLAMDLAILDDNDEIVWDRNEDYELLGSYWKHLGDVYGVHARWGGDWKSLNDIYHVEVD